jgi:hypothetical protein
MNNRKRSLLDLGFFVDYVLANRRIVLLRLQLLGVQALVLRNRVVVAGAGARYEFDFVTNVEFSGA